MELSLLSCKEIVNCKEVAVVTATLTSKGQMTIPKAVRESLRLRSGDRVEFVVHDQSEATLRPITKTVDAVFGRLHVRGQSAVTVARMDGAIARETARARR